MTPRFILSLLAASVATIGCTLIEDEPAAPTWRDLIIDIDCEINPQMDGRLSSSQGEIVIGEADYFALIINQGNYNEGLFTSLAETKPYIDIARSDLKIGSPRLVADDQGGHKAEGATPRSLEPDTFYTRIVTEDFGQQIVVDIPPGKYTIYGRRSPVGQAGTCTKPQP